MYSLTWINADNELCVLTSPNNRTICALYDMMTALGRNCRMWDKNKELMY